MGIALLASARFFYPLCIAMERLLPLAGSMSARRVTPPVSRCSAEAGSPSAHTHRPTIRRPLRVVRVLESGHMAACAGRMTISGSMADVCAELDRLAAAEHTRH